MNVQFTVQVPKTPELEELIQQVRGKLERLLVAFQPELVQFHGRLVRHSAREGVCCSLDINLPTGQMAAEETGDSAQKALRAAADELVKQVKKHKEKLRKGQSWDKRSTVEEKNGAYALEPDWSTPGQAEAAPAAAGQENLARYITANLDQLMLFVERQLRLRQRLGEIEPGMIDGREVLDEVIAQALTEENGHGMLAAQSARQRERWFYLLAANAIRKLSSAGETAGVETISLDRDANGRELQRAEQYEFVSPADEFRVEDLMVDESAATPEQIAYSNEMMELLDKALGRLPRQERDDLVLFTIEGFTPRELAMISGRSPEQVISALRSAQEELARQNEVPPELRRMLVERTAQRLTESAA